MADTRVQLEVEDWVRDHWMFDHFGQQFHRNRLPLSPGGVFDFDAVSEDRKTAACISTSGGTTATGRIGVGKFLKIRSDMLFLLLADGLEKRLIVLTEVDMYQVCLKEKSGGRVPREIEFVLAKIPDGLRTRLSSAKEMASKEVSPR
jgi:hypothetical protein